MTKSRISEIADQHLDAWFGADPQRSTTTLREHVEAAIYEALTEEAGAMLRAGMGPRSVNNPEFIRQCGPGGAPDV
jgi:hypothetical protein